MVKHYLAKIVLFLSQFCYQEVNKIVDKQNCAENEGIEEITHDIEQGITHEIFEDFELLQEVNPEIYYIVGIDREGRQFCTMNWNNDNPNIVELISFIFGSMVSGSTSSLILESLRDNQDISKEHKETIDKVLIHLQDLFKNSTLDVDDDPIMSPLDVFQNIEREQ